MRELIPAIIWPLVFRHTQGGVGIPHTALEKTQFLPPQERELQQFRQLRHLAAFAAEHSPHFRQRLQEAGLTAAAIHDMAALRRLPLLTRRCLQQQLEALDCRSHIPAHAPFMQTKTSGSSGEPVVVYRSAVQHAFWMAQTIREHQWHQRDISGTLAAIRANLPDNKPLTGSDWGPPLGLFYNTGPAAALPVDTDIAAQIAWLHRVQPDYLLVYPNNLAALLDAVEAGKLQLPRLKQLRTIGETVSAELRGRVNTLLGVTVADVYSSQEVGVIACQCPVSGDYHVMEHLLVEVLDTQGNPCAAGETGRVVITDIYSFATPLLRYDIGDYAEAGEAGLCACGRGMQTLRRIRGRERNMLRLADGGMRWPLVGFHRFREIADITQYQIVQLDYQHLEVRLVCRSPLSATQEQALGEVITAALRHAFTLRFVYFTDQIPRGANGKFEEFICAIRPEK